MGEGDVRFGDFIKNLRINKGVSLNQMEREIGLSKSYLSKLENNENINLSMYSMSKLTNYFKIPIEKFESFFDCYCENNNIIDIKDLMLTEEYMFNGIKADKDIKYLLSNIMKIIEVTAFKEVDRIEEAYVLKELDKIRQIVS